MEKPVEKSIYLAMMEAEVPIGAHESDLYAKVNADSKRIVSEYKFRSNVTTFVSQIDGKLWYDIPFAYDPFWVARMKKAVGADLAKLAKGEEPDYVKPPEGE